MIDEAGAADAARAGRRAHAAHGHRRRHRDRRRAAWRAFPPKTRVGLATASSSQTLEPELKQVIFGQDAAIEHLVSARSSCRAPASARRSKPIGSFLFSGPTGVGKTELAKQLARVLGVEFLRFDMSEYMEKHTVSRLIGAPPGYVGFDQGGLLTDAIRKTPHAVLVLDEIEKAHPDVFNILLQVMDHATLTDNNGRKADFRNVILIMTTNAGARELTRQGASASATQATATAHARSKARSSAPSAPSSATASTPGSSSIRSARTSIAAGRRQVRRRARRAARREGRHDRAHRRGARWLAENGYDRRSARADGAADPEGAQEAARRRDPVRAAPRRRPCPPTWRATRSSSSSPTPANLLRSSLRIATPPISRRRAAIRSAFKEASVSEASKQFEASSAPQGL